MKKLALKIVVLFVLAIFFLRIPGYWDNEKTNDPNVMRLRLANGFPNVDILILGNSHAYSGINPVLFDSIQKKALNYATAAAGPVAMKMVFDEYVIRSGTLPKSVLINISPSMFCNGSDVFEKYPIHRYLQTPISNENMLLNGYVGMSQYYKMTVKSFKRGCRNLYTGNEDEPRSNSSVFEYSGYVPRAGVYTDSLYDKNKSLYSSLKNQGFQDWKMNYFTDWINELISQGIKVFIHEIPSNRFHEFIHEKVLEEYYIYIEKLMKNEKVFWVPKANFIQESDFADMDHLNTEGATRYTHFLISYFYDK